MQPAKITTSLRGAKRRGNPVEFSVAMDQGIATPLRARNDALLVSYRVTIISGVMFSSRAMTISTDFSKS